MRIPVQPQFGAVRQKTFLSRFIPNKMTLTYKDQDYILTGQEKERYISAYKEFAEADFCYVNACAIYGDPTPARVERVYKATDALRALVAELIAKAR